MSVSIHMGVLPFAWFYYELAYLVQFPPQIWRLATSFLITDPGLGLLFDTYFLYTYLSQLELGHPKFPRKEDLLWYLMFISGTILVSFDCAVPRAPAHTHPYTPHHICPDSGLPLQLSRFLEVRKITPTSRPAHLIRKGLARGVGMVGCFGWPMCLSIHLGGFI